MLNFFGPPNLYSCIQPDNTTFLYEVQAVILFNHRKCVTTEVYINSEVIAAKQLTVETDFC
jgi:hypothetical protein